MHNINPNFSNRMYQIIKGTVLGGSSLVRSKGSKNCYLSMRSKNSKWLQYKAAELKSLASEKPFNIEITNRWHSFCYPIFTNIENIFYKNGKRFLSKNALDDLNDIAYMIWFYESSIYKQKTFILNTHVWGEENTNKILNYFKLSSFQCSIFKDNGKLRIRFDKDSSIKILKIISPHIPYGFKL